MLPEDAWGLKKGEQIIGTNPKTGKRFKGVVKDVLKIGQSFKDYVEYGMNELEARMREHDPPTIVLFDGTQQIAFNPKYVELVLHDYKLKCKRCNISVILKLRAGKPSTFLQTMIFQNRCAQCINLP